jgi:protein-tyrosine phosphatase
MIENVLIVCAANVCRSPMAMGLLSSLLPGVSVGSAGVSAVSGLPVEPVALAVLQQFAGIDIQNHRARCLTQAICDDAGLILVMEQAQKRAIELQFTATMGKVYCYDPDEDVDDPHRRTRLAYDLCIAHIAAGASRWVNRIRKV